MDTYGKVVDQNDTPLAEVAVEEGVGTYETPTRSGSKTFRTVTDSTGCFHFAGIHGAWAGFNLKKEGYYYDIKAPSTSRPKSYLPDSQAPLIFRMWKLKGAEPLAHHRIEGGIQCDGTPITFDLLTGDRKSSGGDLTISLARAPMNIDPAGPFQWSVTFSAPQGGLQSCKDLYPYEAPAGGYQQSISREMNGGPPYFNNRFEESFYFMSRSGTMFGRMKVEIQGDYQPPPTHYSIEVFTNPNSSRNLEYSPWKEFSLKKQ